MTEDTGEGLDGYSPFGDSVSHRLRSDVLAHRGISRIKGLIRSCVSQPEREQVMTWPSCVRSTGCCPKQAEQLTGFHARVSPGKLEIHFSSETELAELAEALERVTD